MTMRHDGDDDGVADAEAELAEVTPKILVHPNPVAGKPCGRERSQP